MMYSIHNLNSYNYILKVKIKYKIIIVLTSMLLGKNNLITS